MDVTRINGNGYAAPASAPVSVENAPVPAEAFSPAPQAAPTTPAAPEMRTIDRTENRDALRRAVDEINSSIAIHRRHLGIRHHEATNRRIVTVYDSDTNEVLREIPPESVLEAHASMLEMVGLFVNTRG